MTSAPAFGALVRLRLIPHAALTALLALVLAGCGAGKNQAPVASEEEVGQVSEVQEEQPATYTAKAGDTLKRIAARPEIYGDPELWPILQSANADTVGQGMRVNAGTVLNIPRDLTEEQKEEAREKARQAAAASKMNRARRSPAPAVKATAEPAAPAPEAAAPAAPPQPVPKAKKGGGLLSLLVVLLLVLAAVAAVLYYYSRRDEKDGGA